MKKQIITVATLIATIAMFNQGCKPKEVAPPNETELITTVKLSFTDSANTSDKITFAFIDIDGAGGNAPSQFDSIKLAPNKTYNVQIVLLDESKTPADSISNEVLKEGVDHQFFINIGAGLNIVASYQDLDANSNPIGL